MTDTSKPTNISSGHHDIVVKGDFTTKQYETPKMDLKDVTEAILNDIIMYQSYLFIYYLPDGRFILTEHMYDDDMPDCTRRYTMYDKAISYDTLYGILHTLCTITILPSIIRMSDTDTDTSGGNTS